MTWQMFSGSDAEWDNLVTNLASTSPYQTSAWASFKRSAGWLSVRLFTTDDRCAIQALVKRFKFVSVIWAPGGPIGEVTEADLADLAEVIKTRSPSMVQYLRVSDFCTAEPQRHQKYISAGWRQPHSKMSTAQTLVRQLGDATTLHTLYSKNWLRNLRRGEERGIIASVWQSADSAEIARLHQSVVETKGLATSDWRTQKDEISRLIACFGHQLVLVRATDSAGTLLALRGAVITGNLGFDFLAATSVEGRKNYASNVALHHLLSLLATYGVTTYDFGGVDYRANKGVYDFKHGAGGTEHSYVGEFEMVKPRILRSFASTMVASRLPK
jgi:lipid II:glycine glycyltransferase (peptidoglycan interpeptide bridge formation enzyme)